MVTATVASSQAPDVAYYPTCRESTASLVALSTSSGGELGDLPRGFPKFLHSELAWRGKNLAQEPKRWTIDLTEQDLESIDNALHGFEASQLDLSDLTSESFSIPGTLARKLRTISQRCYEGVGFCVVRGIDPERYTPLQNIIVFAGLSSHIAPERGFQDKARKEVLCHVINRTLLQDAAKQKETPAFTDGALSFHTDFGEVLALSTIKADAGGDLLLSSAWQIYNELAASRPDLVRVLSHDWLWDTYTDYEKAPPMKLPLLAYRDGKLIMNCSRYSLAGFGSFRRNSDLPALTVEQVEALNAIHSLATKNAIRLPSQKGDLLYINNMALLHARDPLRSGARTDGSPTLSTRHKLRLFLRDPKSAWKIPQQMRGVWDQLYGPNTADGQRVEHWMIQPDMVPATKWKANG